MLSWIADGFAQEFSGLNVFRYLSFRTLMALLTGLGAAFLMGRPLIRLLEAWQQHGQPIRSDGPETHHKKAGTPTMGGIMILMALGISVLLWTDWSQPKVWSVLLVTYGYAGIGFLDDWLKLKHRSSRGLPGKMKLLLQFAIAGAAIQLLLWTDPAWTLDLHIPFFKDIAWDLGWLIWPFLLCVVAGTSNAVNLTDGLDGLAIVPVMIAATCYGVICYVVGNAVFADYLQIPFVAETGEISVFCGALIGASLGFLWYNAPPAAVFMGDVGSLGLGGALGIISVVCKHELIMLVIGGIFVVEAVSVILQVAYYKSTKKRLFLMAPIHHHFEKKGWSESTVVIRFWIIALILGLLGLTTLKLR